MEPGNHARHMRNNPTDAEAALWCILGARGVANVRFNRQVRIRPSNYICGFVSRTRKLVIEVDGGQHAIDAGEDAYRTRYIEAKGYRVIRFWNNEVLGNLEGVGAEIERVLAEMPTPVHKRASHSPSSAPLPLAGGAGGGPETNTDQPKKTAPPLTPPASGRGN